MKPARSILPAIDQAIEEAHRPRVAIVGRMALREPWPQQAVTPRLAPHPAVLAWMRRAAIDPDRAVNRRSATTNPAGPAAATWCAAPRCQRPH